MDYTYLLLKLGPLCMGQKKSKFCDHGFHWQPLPAFFLFDTFEWAEQIVIRILYRYNII